MFRLPPPSRCRLAIQAGFALFLVWVAVRFHEHVSWAMGQMSAYTPKPGAVEGFLPIAAFMSFKRLLVTGEYDPVHPAGLTIFIAIMLMAWLLRKGFCGHLCPVGLASSLLEKAGRRLGIRRQPGPRLARVLTLPKYIVLGGFVWFIGVRMGAGEIEAFMFAPYNFVADTKMLHFFMSPSTTTLAVVAGLMVGSLVMPFLWCRVLCPYGALLGLLAKVGPTAITRDATSCVGCGRCARACPAGVPVDTSTRVNAAECMGCTECVGACPVTGCLSVRTLRWRLPHWAIGVGCLALLVVLRLAAGHYGLWDATTPPEMLRRFHMMVFGMGG
ncbi:4Fe-4S binding protein [Nitratidesulfovibrio vulgaris]|uniref:4Fe-4S ferredoxin, iron-sulfur binding domain protein n=1 Tax=Nitratidesulfovibrio vulgaris (strain DP4) TaxID=391774 RepID=A0A0H3A6Q4_NITV4|nr:4Fe-4S binding protein [Nitratidesulfovibrio vulgaris]ABM27774.1 4Fe-4S ferredoxin, iron-sulfur binding domain protein [Nitratidesulfovibrio vulgaris DP4]GEB80929.1 hypothetical protein DDE01_23440 [Desulfovibrio desulfuricans]